MLSFPACQIGLDARDAATIALLGEEAAALKLLYHHAGEELTAYLVTQVLPRLGWPTQLQV